VARRYTRAVSAVELRRWTRAEYERLTDAGFFPDGERVELIEGDIVKMAPQDADHSGGIGRGQRALQRAFGPDCWVRVQLPIALGASEPEPDLAVVAGRPDAYAVEHPTTALIVVEIAASSLTYDRDTKAHIYARADVADYWVLNLVDTQLEVHRDPVLLPTGRHGYRTRTIYFVGDTVAPLHAPDNPISVSDLFPRQPQ
jgi:Uma2 family endonuclease